MTGTEMLKDIVLPIGTVIIAVIALSQSCENAENAREHNRLSVHPHVGFYPRPSFAPLLDEGKQATAGFRIANNGLGPAVIDSIAE